jgi:transcriptional regulator with XRE-family HTH domain
MNSSHVNPGLLLSLRRLSLKAVRQQQGMTQAALAEAIDKSFETISNIERGKTAPGFATLSVIGNG